MAENKTKCEYCKQERDEKDIISVQCHRRDRNQYGKAYVRTDTYKVCKDKPCEGYLQMSFEG
jgi:hypothetical protein